MATHAEDGATRGTRRRLWMPVLIVAMILAVAFEIVNVVNEQAAYSLTILISMLITTFPLIAMVVVGVYLVFGKRKGGQS